MMRLSLKLLMSLLLLVGAICAVWQIGQYQQKERVSAAAHLLEQCLSGGKVPEGSASIGDTFKFLLGSNEGAQLVRLLDSKYETVAFHESRNSVYYVHPREGQADDLCIGTVIVNADEGHPLSGHEGFPYFMRLQSLQLEGDVLSIGFMASGDDGYQLHAKSVGLVPGGFYSRKVALKQTTGWQIFNSELAFPSQLDY